MKMKIHQVMTANPSWCVPRDLSTQAAHIMKDQNVGIVPVMEAKSHRRLVGVVTDRDLCLAVVVMDKHPSSVQVHSV